ncbi:MAG TPA: fumarylacetoacetate hydrolase family protein [Pseudonocardia sp.]|jgi:2-keto-4-pentenoate hydratase/2-oxohepta-3-ene-1,7-dioic acid hydratase in catechol pathway|uniref:fumarylacetoacetate hydrolase family protein n=1 Tax=Pseudonocardia sp. TaxID=60912 RepID=UPI002F428FE3
MRWATYRSPRDGRDRVGLLHEGSVHGLAEPASLVELLGGGVGAMRRAATTALTEPAEVITTDQVVLRAPVPSPPSIRDFMAFEEHVVTSMQAVGRTVDPGWYEIPVFYFSNPAAVFGPGDPVRIAPGSAAFDYELEVAVVVGGHGANIPVDRAGEYIAGYTILSDWSARDLQEHEMRQGLGPAKGKDTATTIGPYLVTPDELESARGPSGGLELAMTASVNGRRYSRGSLATIHWSFEQLISYASRGTRLVPGDVIGSGTVGTGCILELSRVHGADSYPWLAPGDRVRLEVERLGHLDCVIEPAEVVHPLS